MWIESEFGFDKGPYFAEQSTGDSTDEQGESDYNEDED